MRCVWPAEILYFCRATEWMAASVQKWEKIFMKVLACLLGDRLDSWRLQPVEVTH